MRAFLEEWRQRAEGGDGEKQLATLRETVAEYKERFEGNAWVQNVLSSL